MLLAAIPAFGHSLASSWFLRYPILRPVIGSSPASIDLLALFVAPSSPSSASICESRSLAARFGSGVSETLRRAACIGMRANKRSDRQPCGCKYAASLSRYLIDSALTATYPVASQVRERATRSAFPPIGGRSLFGRVGGEVEVATSPGARLALFGMNGGVSYQPRAKKPKAQRSSSSSALFVAG
jgi:hypothetical protein